MNRQENLNQLKTEQFDLCIIGGGASGAGAALDATLRGLKVCLIEKEDFAAETSSKSTKLIHGGVRYLEQAFKKLDFGQLKQVKHGLEERHIVLSVAPHLAKPLGLITPVFTWVEGLYYTIGLKIYGLFAKDDNMPKARWLSKAETLSRISTLNPKLHSSVLYYDGQLDDARFCLALAHTADDAGACVMNHTSLTSFEKDEAGKLKAAVVFDHIGNEEIKVEAKVFLNCTGPFADHIRLMANPEEELRMRPSKGVHIMIPKEFLPGKDAMLIPKTKDGRVVFVIPFEGEVMVGTTDDAYNKLNEEPILEVAEVDFLLETLERFFIKKPTKSDIKAGFGGLRPLLAPKTGGKKGTKSLLRDHEVEHDETSNLVSLLGGKWTTYRLMAQDAIDEVVLLLKQDSKSRTAKYKLVGSREKGFDYRAYLRKAENFGLQEDSIEHLVSKYGDQSMKFLDLFLEDETLMNKIDPAYPYIFAEVVYTIRNEMAVSLRDFFARRIRFEIKDWNALLVAIPKVAEVFAKEFGWSQEHKTKMSDEYFNLITEFKKRAAV
ncbi:glycerol-3-phosphate dehydrogenase [Spirosomataceae bacterium TFI 002]|nr:glycerol-3-phosphate dehydrogenase [Spirosomataceae bacterium TFI 002]